jgi:hypothetical protein
MVDYLSIFCPGGTKLGKRSQWQVEEGESMIRAILKNGKIKPMDKLPEHWHEGQELIVEGAEPSGNPAVIKKWYAKLRALSAQIPLDDHQRMATAVAEHDREAKEQMRRDMGLD